MSCFGYGIGQAPGPWGLGADAPGATPAPGPPIPAPDAAFVNVEPDGTRIYKPEVATQLMQMLTSMSVIYVDAMNAKLDVRIQSDPRPAADAWVKDQLAAGKSVLFGSAQGIASAVAPQTGIDRYLKAEADHAGELKDAGPAALVLYAVLARPGLASASIGPFGVAALALGVGALALYAYHAFAKTQD